MHWTTETMVASTQKFRQKTLSPQVAPQAPPPTMISPEGAVAQLVERFPRTEEAGSSNLLRSTQTFPQVQATFRVHRLAFTATKTIGESVRNP